MEQRPAEREAPQGVRRRTHMAISGYREQFLAGVRALLDGREYDPEHGSAWKAGYRRAAELFETVV